MTNPIEQLKDKYWFNIYLPKTDNPNAPICNIEIVAKDNKEERYKYPVWRDKQKDGYGYLGKLDTGSRQVDSHNEAKANGYQSQGDDDINDEIPFAFLLPYVAPVSALMLMGVA